MGNLAHDGRQQTSGDEAVSTGLLALTLFAFAGGSLISLFMLCERNIDLDTAVWWPIALTKFLLKSLFRVLTTGWRP